MIALDSSWRRFRWDPRWRFAVAVVRIGVQPTCRFTPRPIDVQDADEGLAPVKLRSTDLFGALNRRPIPLFGMAAAQRMRSVNGQRKRPSAETKDSGPFGGLNEPWVSRR
ncbi:MAG TPA: hypothetical protein VFC19_17690 [Candidatus Limnocylindrales bacterium]|nr:hypothetical protein [Candidatus Limnocylindrales bacterium]